MDFNHLSVRFEHEEFVFRYSPFPSSLTEQRNVFITADGHYVNYNRSTFYNFFFPACSFIIIVRLGIAATTDVISHSSAFLTL